MITRIFEQLKQVTGTIWLSCPYPEAALELEDALLGAGARVHDGQEPPAGEAPSAIVLCPNGEGDMTSEIGRLRTLAEDAPVLVFASRVDRRLAEVALRAGASGFIYAGMRPAQIVRAVEMASEGETVIPGVLIVGLLGKRLFLRFPRILDP